jgi:hypothetical protein
MNALLKPARANTLGLTATGQQFVSYYACLQVARHSVRVHPELKKGSIEMLILSLVEARPRHAYEIGKLIEARSSGRLTFALPTLYPTLLRLESRGRLKGLGSKSVASVTDASIASPLRVSACWWPGVPSGARTSPPLTTF